MASVASELVRRNVRVRYAVTPDLFTRLKSSFDRGSRENGAEVLAEL
jgi:DNA replication protein DnaC